MDDDQRLLLAFGAAVAAALLGVAIVLVLDLPAGWATVGLFPTLWVVGALLRRR